jgi:hypothetical protein
MSALKKQPGGTHYKDMGIQPVAYAHANNLGFMEANVVKYISRHQSKGGSLDVKKAIHYCQLILELRYGDHLRDARRKSQRKRKAVAKKV